MLGDGITVQPMIFPGFGEFFLELAKIGWNMSSSVPEEHLKYPIGRYQAPSVISSEQRTAWIEEMAKLPLNLNNDVAGLNDAQLDTPYRPGGWTIRQVVHHIPDSHMNSYMRFRLALTENVPLIKPYDEGAWAQLIDARTAPIAPSLAMLEGLHTRFVLLLKSLSDADFARTFRHPELGERRLDWTLGLYAWHSLHHVAHINNAKK